MISENMFLQKYSFLSYQTSELNTFLIVYMYGVRNIYYFCIIILYYLRIS